MNVEERDLIEALIASGEAVLRTNSSGTRKASEKRREARAGLRETIEIARWFLHCEKKAS